MKLLITGASGLIGSALCRYFLRNGCQVTGVVNTQVSQANHTNYSQMTFDLVNQQLQTGNSSFDAVIHCAALIPGKQSASDEQLMELNQRIDQTIFSYCHKNTTRLIYFSTAYMYAGNGSLNEKTPLRSDLGGYYLSKKKSEEALKASGISHVIFRISSPYGQLDKQSNVMRLFADKIKAGETVTLVGKGKRRQNFIHTEDIGQACSLAAGSPANGIFNLTYSKSYSMLDLASMMKELYHSDSEIVFDSSKAESAINVDFDNSRLRTEFNWVPETDLKTGLIKTLFS